MKIATLKEIHPGEQRVAITPESAKRLQKAGFSCLVETGCGAAAMFSDDDYTAAGVEVLPSAAAVCQSADILVKVRPPEASEVTMLGSQHTLISFISPAQNTALLEQLKVQEVNTLAMDMIPRISRAQKMDALSSMANIAGYRAVTEAATAFGRFFNGQVTAAGNFPPAKVLVIGAGVAGLAAIGHALSLGAIVRAFDVRLEVAEQIESMGAEALRLDFEEDNSGEGGYAAPSSPEFREKQLALFREQAREVDIVITTALIPGREAPKLWLQDMVETMKSGSVVVDLAAEQGGNCDLTIAEQKVVSDNGVNILGYTDLTSRMANQSSSLYANNIVNLMSELAPDNDGVVDHNMEDEVIRAATVTCGGDITFPPPPLDSKHFVKPATAPTKTTGASDGLAEKASPPKRWVPFAVVLMGIGFVLFAGYASPPAFMQHLVVFILACFIGFQVISNVNHALHTPLMAITNAISGIVIVGALLQSPSSVFLIKLLALISISIATVNIVGGFLITHRMLNMFKKS